ncbi:MAG: SDR family oxidoreductase [Actinomycetota bacterium]|nr:SDR family oxidoreductase [Actinomycetota bacterium]
MTPTQRSKKVSVVAGGGRGIGATVASQLSELGHEVIVLDFPEPVDLGKYQSGSILESSHPSFGLDLRDEVALQGCTKAIFDRFGEIDTLTITAGAIDGGTSALNLCGEEILESFSRNVLPIHNCIRAFASIMTNDSWNNPFTRSIVALTSVASIKALRGLAAYSTAKAGLRGYLMVTALELSDIELRLNVVVPGSTRGAMLDASRDLYRLQSSDEFAIHHLSKRIIEREEVAEAIISLHRNTAMIASEVVVDGGMAHS